VVVAGYNNCNTCIALSSSASPEPNNFSSVPYQGFDFPNRVDLFRQFDLTILISDLRSSPSPAAQVSQDLFLALKIHHTMPHWTRRQQ
jgi:hypothetical protein